MHFREGREEEGRDKGVEWRGRDSSVTGRREWRKGRRRGG
jgi:hypothetical protein